MAITVISYPTNEIDYTLTEVGTLDSGAIIQNIWVDVSEAITDEYIEVTFNDEVITLLITDECRYTPIDVCFFNKEGEMQILPFFKAKTENLTVTNESYESDNGQPLAGNHQFVRYNVQGKSAFKINSGFVSEDLNQTFKQLFLSTRVWMFTDGIYTPINLGSKSLEYKTRQKDRLINYECEFEYAFNEINNI
jgi:hypothetical protein